MIRYTYDKQTFRLLRQRSEKYSKSTGGSTITNAYNSGTTRQDDGFNYDLVGNIVKLLDRMKDCGIGGTPDALDREFEYDPIYRLTYADGRESDTQSGNTYLYEDAPSATGLGNVRAYSRTYSYDKLGNVIDLVQDGTNGFTRHFEYNPGKNTLKEINDGSPTFSLIEDYSYDANGNQLSSNLNRHYGWNYGDQLICYKNQIGLADPTVYTQYDYAGQDRVSKLVRTGTAGSPIYERTIYIDGIFEYVKLENGSNTYEKNYIHIMDNKSRIAEIRINPGTAFPGDISDDITFIIENQIGSSVMRTDTLGDEIDREEYYPFGDSSLRTFTYKRYRYVGKERDSESGLYYYGARYYAAWTCRFISVDPLMGKYNWQSSYVHADNNPINKVDHNGMGTDESDNRSKKGNDSPADNPAHGQSRAINGCTEYWNSKAAEGKGAWVDNDPTQKLDEVVVKPKRGFWGWIKDNIIDNIPVVGGIIRAVENFKKGDWVGGLIGVGEALLDAVLLVTTAGIGNIIKQGLKTGVKTTLKIIAKETAENVVDNEVSERLEVSGVPTWARVAVGVIAGFDLKKGAKYAPNPKHGSKNRGNANKAPSNPQFSLENSFELPGNTTRRVGADKSTGEFNIFDEHSPGNFHGHSRTWDELTQDMKNVLIKNGVVNRKGKIL